jgi:hypothetical protein
MEALTTTETLVNFYETTRGNIPDDWNLQIVTEPIELCNGPGR